MSSLINCPSCDNKISEKALTCPKCGHPIKHKNDNNLLLIIGFILTIIGFYLTPFLVIGLVMILIYPLATLHSYLLDKGKINKKP